MATTTITSVARVGQRNVVIVDGLPGIPQYLTRDIANGLLRSLQHDAASVERVAVAIANDGTSTVIAYYSMQHIPSMVDVGHVSEVVSRWVSAMRAAERDG